jgi:protein kinase-like protein
VSLAVGSRIGPYEVLSVLGAGGMGEVFRARDTRLNRDVALKTIPAVFAGDSDRLARFEREARVLATLNHPHIAPIYGIENDALLLELVAFDKFAYSDGRCYGMKQADLQKLGSLPDPPATLQQREIDQVADFLFAKVVGQGPMDRQKCIEYWGADVDACKEFK